jgi:hypothetical protein
LSGRKVPIRVFNAVDEIMSNYQPNSWDERGRLLGILERFEKAVLAENYRKTLSIIAPDGSAVDVTNESQGVSRTTVYGCEKPRQADHSDCGSACEIWYQARQARLDVSQPILGPNGETDCAFGRCSHSVVAHDYVSPSGATMLDAAGYRTRRCVANMPFHPVAINPDEDRCWRCQGTEFEVV